MEVKLLTPAEIAEWRFRLHPFIAAVASRSRGRYATEHLFAWALSGEWQIWVVLESGWITFVCGTEIVAFPTGLKCLCFRFGTGRGRERWQERIGDVLAWGVTQGCGIWEGHVRRGWGRVLAPNVPGLMHTHDIIEGSF